MSIGVLVVDDSALVRRQLRRIIGEAPGLHLVDTARDGEDAIDKIRRLRPDVVTLDVNLPLRDGLSVLRDMMAEEICPAIMLSSITQEGSRTAMEALEAGAFECIAKPDGTASSTMDRLTDELLTSIRAAARPGVMRRLVRRQAPRRTTAPRLLPQATISFKAVALGLSTGGPRSILDVLPLLPEGLNAAIFITQHMPPSFTRPFAARLDSMCQIKVMEASPGQRVEPGCCYLAPGGRHLTLLRRSDNTVVIRTPSHPKAQFMPSVGVMMESVLAIYGGADTIGVLMTGMGSDGADGMVKIRQAGGWTIAESEETAIVFGMPAVAIQRGGACEVSPCYKIAEHIIRRVG